MRELFSLKSSSCGRLQIPLCAYPHTSCPCKGYAYDTAQTTSYACFTTRLTNKAVSFSDARAALSLSLSLASPVSSARSSPHLSLLSPRARAVLCSRIIASLCLCSLVRIARRLSYCLALVSPSSRHGVDARESLSRSVCSTALCIDCPCLRSLPATSRLWALREASITYHHTPVLHIP